MQANPDKFQFLAVGRKTCDKNPSIHIQNFDAHISTICRKASQQLNILKRLGSYLNRLNKLNYISYFHT